MKTYYCVTTTFDDFGRVTAGLTNQIEAESKPKNTYTSTVRKDIYCDWFGSMQEANEYVESAKLA